MQPLTNFETDASMYRTTSPLAPSATSGCTYQRPLGREKFPSRSTPFADSPRSPSILRSSSERNMRPRDRPMPPLPAMPTGVITEDERRARQRLHVQRSYHKKKDVMKDMRAKVAALEQQYADLVQKQTETRQRVMVDLPLVNVNVGAGPSQQTSLIQLYTQLSSAKEALHHENEEHRKRIHQYELFSQNVLRYVRQEERNGGSWGWADDDFSFDEQAWISATSVPPSRPIEGDWSSATEEEEDIVSIHPLTLEECEMLAFRSYNEICTFMETNRGQLGVADSVSTCGWREYRVTAPGRIDFIFQKLFANQRADALSEQSWKVLSSPQGLAGLSSSTIPMRFRVVQVINADTVVLYRETAPSGGHTISKSLFMAARYIVGTAHVILFRSIDHMKYLPHPPASREANSQPPLGDTKPSTTWSNVFSWTMFQDVGGDQPQCTFTYGGAVDTNPNANVRLWMMEVLLLVLRMETAFVGPPFRLIQ